MIRLMESFIPWDIHSARAHSARRTYADGQFWAQDDNAAVLSLVDGFALLGVRANADWEELRAFLELQPWARLRCAAGVAEQLPWPVAKRQMTVRFAAPKRPCAAPLRAQTIDDIRPILQNCFPDTDDDYFADLALRWRRGTGESWVLGGACTVSAIDLAEGFCFLGAVGTLPQARGQGLAGQLLCAAASHYQSEGRDVYLSCREALLPFYESVGFERAESAVEVTKEACAHGG